MGWIKSSCVYFRFRKWKIPRESKRDITSWLFKVTEQEMLMGGSVWRGPFWSLPSGIDPEGLGRCRTQHWTDLCPCVQRRIRSWNILPEMLSCTGRDAPCIHMADCFMVYTEIYTCVTTLQSNVLATEIDLRRIFVCAKPRSLDKPCYLFVLQRTRCWGITAWRFLYDSKRM